MTHDAHLLFADDLLLFVVVHLYEPKCSLLVIIIIHIYVTLDFEVGEITVKLMC